MSRDEKRYGFKPVDDKAEPLETGDPVIRLGKNDAADAENVVRLTTKSPDHAASHRLHVPDREEFETRSHQPGIEALIEQNIADPDQLEQTWGEGEARQRGIPWGWFALIGLILAGGVAWSLRDVQKGEAKVEKIKDEAESQLVREAEEIQEAADLIARIDTVTAAFFAASDIESLLPLVRQPERVRPLMEKFHAKHPLQAQVVESTRMLEPVTIGKRADFWMKSVTLNDRTVRNLIIEITPEGEPKVDWETLVCYQPMEWDAYALERPRKSMDFRVYLEPDTFFSHEFADQSQWESFRLTAADSDETLFGYTRRGGELSARIAAILKESGGHQGMMILRLGIPENVESRRGVLIEAVRAERWLYVEPPETGS